MIASLNPALAEVASRFLKSLPALVLALSIAGCSSFNRDWKAAAGLTPPPGSLEGRWEGTWHSDVNDHSHQLRCLVTHQGNGIHTASFRAKYRKVFTWTVHYTVPLTVEDRGDSQTFEGEANLGWYAGGRYAYRGYADGTNFFSTYRCDYDHGSFKMARPLTESPN